MAYLNFTDSLMEAKRRARLQGRDVSQQEAAGLSEGVAKSAGDRVMQEQSLLLNRQAAETQKTQFSEQLAEQKRQYEGMLEERSREFAGTQGNFAAQLALEKGKFNEEKERFTQTFALQTKSLQEQINQANANLELRKKEFESATGLQKQQIQLEIQKAETQKTQFEAQLRTQQENFTAQMTQAEKQFQENLKLERERIEAEKEAAANSGDGGGICIIVTAATDRHSLAVEIARAYRDRFLDRKALRGYYMIAERVVPLMKKWPWFKGMVKRFLVDNLVEYGRYALEKAKVEGKDCHRVVPTAV